MSSDRAGAVPALAQVVTIPQDAQQSLPRQHPVVILGGSVVYDRIITMPNDSPATNEESTYTALLARSNTEFMSEGGTVRFGGNVGNIAYVLKMCGGAEPYIVSAAGEQDFGDYADHLERHRIDSTGIARVGGEKTATALIVNYPGQDKQKTHYERGAMATAIDLAIPAIENARLGVLTSNRIDVIHKHADEFNRQSIPLMFAPGQATKRLCNDAEQLRQVMDKADYLVVNDDEAKMICHAVGKNLQELQKQFAALIVTRGSEGSHIYANGQLHEIPCHAVDDVVDPTGCGDAYLAGVIHGMTGGTVDGWAVRQERLAAHPSTERSTQGDMNRALFDWDKIGRFAAVVAGLTITKHGGQTVSFTPGEVLSRIDGQGRDSPGT